MTTTQNLEQQVLEKWRELQNNFPAEHLIRIIGTPPANYGQIAKLGQLPVVVEYSGSDEQGKWDYGFTPREVPKKTSYEETIAGRIFTYTQLEAVHNSLREDEIPKRILLKHYERGHYWCDEWTDSCRITISLELTSGAQVMLCEKDSLFESAQDYHHYRHYHNYKLKREK